MKRRLGLPFPETRLYGLSNANSDTDYYFVYEGDELKEMILGG